MDSPRTTPLPAHGTRKSPRILVVDDDSISLRVMVAAVQRHGEILSASDPVQALGLVPVFRPDILVTDYTMPGRNGLELFRQARELVPGLLCIMVSANEDRKMAIDSLNQGVWSFLSKPTDLRLLASAVDRAWRHMEAQRDRDRMFFDLTRFRALLDHLDRAILIVDLATLRFVDANATAMHLLGRGREELLRLGPADVDSRIGARDARWWQGFAERAQRRGGAVTYRSRYRRKDGSEFPAEVFALVHGVGSGGYVLGLVRDVTEHLRHQAEEQHRQRQFLQQSRLATLGTLVAGVAHEVNNPNNFILMNLPFLKEMWEGAVPVLDEHARRNPGFMLGEREYATVRDRIPRLFGDALEGGRRIKRIVEELRNFASRQPLHMAPVDVNRVAEGVLTMMASTIPKATRRFRRELAGDLPLVLGDSQRLAQVLISLLQNALDALAGPEQAVVLRTAWNAGRRQVEFTVEDEGCGIPPEHLPRLGEPFFTTKREKKGLGMGLSTAFAIVRNHGGDLDITSAPGKGTRVTVSLPSRQGAPAGPAAV